LLQRAQGQVFVLTEGLFSMDGDLGLLPEIAALTERHGAFLIVDEAHSTGIFGHEGAGLAVAEKIASRVFARVHTFGKAVGRAGAVVVSGTRLRQFLINRSRAFIYTTAMPNAEAARLIQALQWMRQADDVRDRLFKRLEYLATLLNRPSFSGPIVPIVVPGNQAVRAAAKHLQDLNLDVRPILAPSVAPGSERLRIVVHAFNTEAELLVLSKGLQPILGSAAFG
jgi:8-amino-7-oxononanoate synthase